MISADPAGTFLERIVAEGGSLPGVVQVAHHVLDFEAYNSTQERTPVSASRRDAMVATRTRTIVFERTESNHLDETDAEGDPVVVGEDDRTLALTWTLLPTSRFRYRMRAIVEHAVRRYVRPWSTR